MMKSLAKLVIQASKNKFNATSTLSKTLIQMRAPAFSQVPRNNFSKKNEKESEDKEEELKTKQQNKKTEKEDKDSSSDDEVKDNKKQDETQKNPEKETVKKLPNSIEELIKIGSEEANKKIISIYKELQDSKNKLDSSYKSVSEEKTTYQNQTTQWQEKAKEFKKIVEQTLNDMELMRVRLEKEKDQSKIFAISKFAGEILEVGDNIDRALQANKELEGKQNSLYEGTLMTQKLLESILIRNGVVKLNPDGEKFDPNLHEALCQVPDPTKEDGSVAFVAQSGFKIHDRVLRPAKVGVTYKV